MWRKAETSGLVNTQQNSGERGVGKERKTKLRLVKCKLKSFHRLTVMPSEWRHSHAEFLFCILFRWHKLVSKSIEDGETLDILLCVRCV